MSMMVKEKAWIEFAALPPDAQYQVVEFIEFLRTRYAQRSRAKASQKTKLLDEPFIGMWKDRDDMQDSTAWVRNLRETEWSVTHE